MPFYLYKNNQGRYPCIFESVKKQKINAKTSFYYSWQWLRQYGNGYSSDKFIDEEERCVADLDSQVADLERVDACDQLLVDKTVDLILQSQINASWLHTLIIGGLDIYGHTFGFCSKEYIHFHNHKLDSYIQQIINALKQKSILHQVKIILTSDHGASLGTNYHGQSKSDDNLEVPLIYFSQAQFKQSQLFQ